MHMYRESALSQKQLELRNVSITRARSQRYSFIVAGRPIVNTGRIFGCRQEVPPPSIR